MKKVFLFMTAVFLFTVSMAASGGQASPFLVCDPQAGVTTYKLTGPAWVPTTVPAQTDGSIKMDVAASAIGANSLTVAACIADPLWGESCSAYVPFAYTRPLVPGIPADTRLSP